LRRNSHGRRCGRLRSRQNSATLRFHAHIHRPYSRRYRVGCDCRRIPGASVAKPFYYPIATFLPIRVGV
jgi:hypothetical protein